MMSSALAVTLLGYSFEVRDAIPVAAVVVVLIVAAWYVVKRRR